MASVFLLAFPLTWYTIILLVTLVLAHFINFSRNDFRTMGKLPLLLLVLLIIYVWGIWNEPKLYDGIYTVRNKFYYLFIPLLFCFKEINIRTLKNTWIWGAGIMGAALLLAAIIRFAISGDASEFYYGNLSLRMHPSYFALMVLIGWIWLIQKKQKGTWDYALGVLFLALLYLLSARAIHIAAIVTALVMLVHAFIYNRGIKYLVYTIVGATLICGTVRMMGKGINRTTEMVQTLAAKDKSKAKSSTNVRLLMWQSVYDHKSEIMPGGVGAQHATSFLHAKWQEDGMDFLKERGYTNVHNQYLQLFVVGGILGLLALCLVLLYFLRYPEPNIYNWVVTISIAIALLFECTLERQMGVTTVVTAFCIMAYREKRKSS
ncbi:O-antigen ligase family protein [Luteibaculum oceani]|uniref:O-antigen ligase family protein n=1 Tax=Luteibaculum oceani TaxID=1294296 RepID=A0A5C6UU85_9FLAO|nr:O-antigen ligase family protein [Luteibaculum oceani]TXC76922.1 O-antigen ligase family protein [Luteibaculum oceani]